MYLSPTNVNTDRNALERDPKYDLPAVTAVEESVGYEEGLEELSPVERSLMDTLRRRQKLGTSGDELDMPTSAGAGAGRLR